MKDFPLPITETQALRTPQARADYATIIDMLRAVDRLQDQAQAMQPRNAGMACVATRLSQVLVALLGAVLEVEEESTTDKEQHNGRRTQHIL